MAKFGRLQNLILQIKSNLPIEVKRERKKDKYSLINKFLNETKLLIKVKRELKYKYSLVGKFS